MATVQEIVEVITDNANVKVKAENINPALSLEENGLDSLDTMMVLHELNTKYKEITITKKK